MLGQAVKPVTRYANRKREARLRRMALTHRKTLARLYRFARKGLPAPAQGGKAHLSIVPSVFLRSHRLSKLAEIRRGTRLGCHLHQPFEPGQRGCDQGPQLAE